MEEKVVPVEWPYGYTHVDKKADLFLVVGFGKTIGVTQDGGPVTLSVMSNDSRRLSSFITEFCSHCDWGFASFLAVGVTALSIRKCTS